MYIYGLYSTENDEIRYVGKTKNRLKQRLYEHLYSSLTRKCKTYKDKWIRSVYENGFQVNIKLIEEVSNDIWESREIYWISKLPNLTNLCKGGETSLGGKLKEYLSYDEAKNWLNSNAKNVKSRSQYFIFYENNSEIKNLLPKHPEDVYKLRGVWVGWSDYLSSDNLNNEKIDEMFLKYNEAKIFLREHYKLDKVNDYFAIKNKPRFLPSNPKNTYTRLGTWVSWEDFLYLKKVHFLNYNDAKKYIINNNIKTIKEYRKHIIDNKIEFLPLLPKKHYKNKGWNNYSSFFGIEKYDINYDLFIRYMRIYHKGMKTCTEYKNEYIKNNISKKIVKRPDNKYKKIWSEIFNDINNLEKQ